MRGSIVDEPELADSELADADSSPECPDCRRQRENYQVVGLSVFCLSLVSCGTLMPIAIPLAFYLQVMSTRKCKACRAKPVVR